MAGAVGFSVEALWLEARGVRYLEAGETAGGRPGFIECLPGERLRVWVEGEGYAVEHVPLHWRSLVERSLLAHALSPSGGVVLHASAVKAGSGAHVFAGRSGAGKSTIASNAPHPIISDDTVVITRSEGGLLLQGTPYGKGDAGHDPERRRLAGICFLGQAGELTVRSVEAAEAVPRLIKALFLPPIMEGESESRLPGPVIETLMDLAQTTPLWSLEVPLGYSFDPADLR